ncbi:molybdate ABC transporter substrate-binding protein [Actinophytocola xinjiangensis]|uniref:Molybdate ABC transporter substrate-binding protein n=1 Tax=Actinophytocola xinjiangensis TaxID=485602 RepID=A0A7Z0WCQ9_9PSEU|nr:molybdate ABC transporter substrate-binding protein [Actinophytocola xinjiangensis]OLF04409.1 molybdate ABC transporter substrate-binding protein [Actinophytocola xinjiangensis]
MSRFVPVLAVVAALAVAGCSSSDPGASDGESTGTSGPAAPEVTGDLTVFAAASLTETFTELGENFEAANPEVSVTFNFAGSSALAKQINEGAPADVFASAAPRNMTETTDTGAVTADPVTFVTNTLEIAVPAGNPAGVTGLADFGKEDLKIGLCAEQVPCGAASKKVFEAAGVTPAPDTLEQDVKAVLTKVSLGEVDAALVYRTDVKAAGDKVEGIEFPESADAVNDYPIAPCAQAPNPQAAQAFIDYVLSQEGQAVLTEAGFGTP